MRFTYEDLSDGQFENLIVFLRQLLLCISVRPIITLIDSDLPTRAEKQGSVFDEGEQGRLFKMAALVSAVGT
jgi:uncharacterized protein YydD (DUF2326 family)